MSSDPFGGGYQEEKERIEREGFEVDWDDVLTDLEWGLPQAAAQAASVFSHVDWNKLPRGGITLARAEERFTSHPRFRELQELIKDIALDTLGNVVDETL